MEAFQTTRSSKEGFCKAPIGLPETKLGPTGTLFLQDRVFLSTLQWWPLVIRNQREEWVASKCRKDFLTSAAPGPLLIHALCLGRSTKHILTDVNEVSERFSHVLALKPLQLFSTSVCLKISKNSNQMTDSWILDH